MASNAKNSLKVMFLVVLPIMMGMAIAALGIFQIKSVEWKVAIIAAGCLLLIIGMSLRSANRKKCQACGRWNALKVIDKQPVSKEPTAIKKTLKEEHKNKKGEIIRTIEKEVMVPGVKITYLVKSQCKYCKNEKEYYSTSIFET
jgi:hypothetical protein